MGLLAGQTQQAYYNGSDHGNYQFVSLDDIIDSFLAIYVGEGKLIDKASRTDVVFHARRALQEFSFDTFKSIKSQEIELPPSLTMTLPHDYVNYVKLTWNDKGVERIIYPASKTSNPNALAQLTDGSYTYDADGNLLTQAESDTWADYKVLNGETKYGDTDITYDELTGRRYGLDPQHAQVNGSFYIDELKGTIHFSSVLSGETIILKYISDSMGTDTEMKVHKFAEEAMYKAISYSIYATKANVPEYVVNRLKKERFATKRVAKLRLSNIKLEEITQILRGQSKQIKH